MRERDRRTTYHCWRARKCRPSNQHASPLMSQPTHQVHASPSIHLPTLRNKDRYTTRARVTCTVLTVDEADPTTTVAFSKRKHQLARLPASSSARLCKEVSAMLEPHARCQARVPRSSHCSPTARVNALVALLVLDPNALHPPRMTGLGTGCGGVERGS